MTTPADMVYNWLQAFISTEKESIAVLKETGTSALDLVSRSLERIHLKSSKWQENSYKLKKKKA